MAKNQKAGLMSHKEIDRRTVLMKGSALAVWSMVGGCATIESPRKDLPSIAMRAGPFLGRADGRGVTWRGIRYAHADRFAMPHMAELPATETTCFEYGPACAQSAGLGAVPSEVEDALLLNIWSPAATGAKRPVLVWIHGGGFLAGAGSQYDGVDLSALGDIVVVTFNYRLGALGFADFSELGVPLNLGLRDQIAALHWVKANISLFGGDPEQVTVAGESAGSMSISLLMASRAVTGLFRGAIMQSGALNLVHDAAFARTLGQRYRSLLGDDAASLAKLRAMPVKRLLDIQAQITGEFPGTISAAPVFDGDFLPASFEAARTTETPAIPLIVGSTSEEVRYFELPGARSTLTRDRPALLAEIGRQLGDPAAARIGAAYPDTKDGNRQMATDANFLMPMRNLATRHAAAGHPVWTYRFDLGGLFLGAAHAIDLTYIWPMKGVEFSLLRGGPLSGDRRRLAERMQTFWVTFVRDGTPGDGWPRFLVADRQVRIFDRQDQTERDADGDRVEAWNGNDVAMARIAVGR